MKFQAWLMSLTCLAVLPVMAPAQITTCSQPRLVEFDYPPGAILIAPLNMNDLGEVVGNTFDTNGVYDGFLRTPDGKITTFEAPGAITGVKYHGTGAFGVNDFGVIVGRFATPDFVIHGYVRHVDGSFTIINVKDAGTAAGQGTSAWTINLQGTTAGIYTDTTYTDHGFVRTPGGTITEFDPVGSYGTEVCLQTCINLAGAVTGSYYDLNYTSHGFVRGPDGKITPFDAPGADLTPGDYNGTYPASINALGAITGTYADVDGFSHGFLRTPDGHITTIDDPAASLAGGGNLPLSINALGVIAGSYYDAYNVVHGFSRSPSGRFFTIDAPGASTAPGDGVGTFADANNLFGAVSGQYIDTDFVSHGFVWTPPCGGLWPQ